MEKRYLPALRFRALTRFYDRIVRGVAREVEIKDALIAQAAPRAGQRVLDVGCGTGTLAIRLKQRHPDVAVTGLDADPDVLALAARKARDADVEVRFDQALATALPYPDASFDRVLSSWFFHHLIWPAKQTVAAEIRRVLRPGGELHVADWGRASGWRMRVAFLPVQVLDGFDVTRDHVAGRLPDVFRSAGYSAVAEGPAFDTVFGTIALVRAVAPAT